MSDTTLDSRRHDGLPIPEPRVPSPEATSRLPAIEPEWTQQALADPTLLRQIAAAVGGPFHVLSADQFRHNCARFIDAMATAGIAGKVYFGKKANKARCFPKACAQSRCGVDVASVPELVEALGSGIRGEDIVVTGPAKNSELLWLAARHGALVAADGPDELDRIVTLAQTSGRMRILLRILPAANPESRFGFSNHELTRAIRCCAEHRDHIAMEGFSFHLTGYDIAPRAWQAAELIDQCAEAQRLGLVADSVSIGGGFGVNYLTAERWQAFQASYDDSLFHTRKTFGGFYPYHQDPAGAASLAAILSTTVPSEHGNLAKKLSANGIRLLVEPGRALLDGCGFTVFPVLGYKHRTDYGFLTVQGLSMSLSEQWFDSEYLPEPTLWPPGADDEPVNACVGGASCLETDMLTWRLLRFPREPCYGDLLVYPNTAGYQMDSNESEFHQLPLPTKTVVSVNGSTLRWRLA